ncbi:radical SAM/SPASM protein FxsBH, inactivated beta-hydroxylase extension form [Streptomyces sp. YU58]|uniref:radical SAM/SPASM protein FxsBH, inactivated beta-hydroxylase extension form n=1 Tax=Streptomyces sp. SX92 TaxID=3158972 RepID=UPI0027B8877D|nr:radical SAM/SPASM protein FxsB, inactivated metallohydrolase extension form [Streptomyces coralus]WLW55333.1 radical SAM/SPASM protein FxsB, inactivated metallohydrolase extension form [Streptomyces coralus]
MSNTTGDIPLQQLVLKIHSRCDLACDHCYVYEHADKSWKTRPVVIGEETVRQVACRFAEYARSHKLSSVTVILHGGEPLLAGPARIRSLCTEFSSALASISDLDLRIHTNGLQLSRRHLDVFKEFDVMVSVSLDGDRAANDRHRLDRRDRSSYDRVLRAIDLLRAPEYRHLFGGLLCTVDVENDPVVVHDALTALGPPRIDYLLPHSTWDSPPPRGSSGSPTPYADWLLAIFDRWTEQGRTVRVRTFDSVLSTLRGGPSLTEAMGLAPSDLAVVETDGSFEQADWLKTAYEGAPATGYNVHDHDFDRFARHHGVQARQRGLLGLAETCRSCPVVESCGGGLYGHRYSSARDFDNPSVFCADLRALVEGIAERITQRSFSPAVLGPAALRSAQQEQDFALLNYAGARLAGHPDWDAVWRALMRLDADPETARHLNRVLAHPYVRLSLRQAGPADSSTARFAAATVAAAWHARTPLRLAWHQADRNLHLPTLGTLTLPAPGRVEATVAGRELDVLTADGDRFVVGEQPTDVWRPLTRVSVSDTKQLLVDDADPLRAVFASPVAAPLAEGDLTAFGDLLRTACKLRAEQGPEDDDDPHALRVGAVTPLVAGSGPQLDTEGLGGLGVPVDFHPLDLVRELPRLGRRARLAALRATTDLHVPGNRAGRLFTEAVEGLADRAYWGHRAPRGVQALERAGRALDALAALPDRELTETGRELAAQLGRERAAWAGEA